LNGLNLEFCKSDHNIDHGCPQGCDNAGRIIDKVEASDKRYEWICWILSKEDIDMTVRKMGNSGKEISEEKCQEIAKMFIKGFEWANEDWGMILEEAIEEVLK